MRVMFNYKYFQITRIILIKIPYNLAKIAFWPTTIQSARYIIGQRQQLRKSGRKCHGMKLNFSDSLDPHTRVLYIWVQLFPHAIDMLVVGEIDEMMKRGRKGDGAA